MRRPPDKLSVVDYDQVNQRALIDAIWFTGDPSTDQRVRITVFLGPHGAIRNILPADLVDPVYLREALDEHDPPAPRVTDDELAMFRAHIVSVANGSLPTCPVCSEQKWLADRIVAPPVHRHEDKNVASALKYKEAMALAKKGREINKLALDVLPMMALVCAKCFFVLQFAWLPIKERMKDNPLTETMRGTSEG